MNAVYKKPVEVAIVSALASLNQILPYTRTHRMHAIRTFHVLQSKKGRRFGR